MFQIYKELEIRLHKAVHLGLYSNIQTYCVGKY